MSSFSQVRNQLLPLQNQLAAKLSQYSAYTSAPGSSASDDEIRLCGEIDSLMQRIQDDIKALDRIVESSPTESVSTSKLQQLSRHKETLAQFRVDYRHIQGAIAQERDRTNLLSNVRSEIGRRRRAAGPEDEEGYMMDERMRIDRQQGVMDQLLDGIMQTRDELVQQRGSFRNMGAKLQKSLAEMPGINVVLGRINTRRKKNSLIIATVIVVCIIGLWFLS